MMEIDVDHAAGAAEDSLRVPRRAPPPPRRCMGRKFWIGLAQIVGSCVVAIVAMILQYDVTIVLAALGTGFGGQAIQNFVQGRLDRGDATAVSRRGGDDASDES